MAAALDNFANMADERKVALLGDMRELGEDSVAEHINVLRRLERLGLYKVCLVGEEFRKALDDTGLNFSWFPSSDELAASLAEHPLEGCVILVKGSRGIRMEKVIPAL